MQQKQGLTILGYNYIVIHALITYILTDKFHFQSNRFDLILDTGHEVGLTSQRKQD